MKIGFDGKRGVSNMTGLGNYSRLVMSEIATKTPDNEILVYAPKLKENPRLSTLKSLGNVEFRLPPPQGLKGSLWRSFGITNNLRADGIDIYHGLSNELPLNIRNSGVPSVVTIHDLIYRRMPECYKWIDRKLYDYKYGASCRNADRIIAISECTRRDIIDLYGINPDKIDVIYQGCDPSFRIKWTDEQLADLRRRYNLPSKYILQVGTIEKRKNLELTVRALSSLDRDVDLVVVGKDHYGYKKYVDGIAEQLGLGHRIHYFAGLDFKDLPGFNQAASVIAYPSRYEGFGIPVIEGLESMRPVVAATGSCLEEAGGENTLYVNPDSPQEMGSALMALLRGGRDVDEMVKASKEYATRFNTPDMVSGILRSYEQTIEDFRNRHKQQ